MAKTFSGVPANSQQLSGVVKRPYLKSTLWQPWDRKISDGSANLADETNSEPETTRQHGIGREDGGRALEAPERARGRNGGLLGRRRHLWSREQKAVPGRGPHGAVATAQAPAELGRLPMAQSPGLPARRLDVTLGIWGHAFGPGRGRICPSSSLHQLQLLWQSLLVIPNIHPFLLP